MATRSRRSRARRVPWGALVAGGLFVALAAFLVVRMATAPEVVEPERPQEVKPQLAAYLTPFLDAVRKDPRSAAAWAELGLVYEANEMWSEARKCFVIAADLDPREPHAPYHAALMALEMAQSEVARAEIEEVRRRHPDFAPAHQRLGLMLLDAGDAAGALPALERAVALAPHDSPSLGALADAKLALGDAQGALEVADRALAANPRDGAARYARGVALRNLGRLDEASAALAGTTGGGRIATVDAWAQRLPPHAKGLARQLARATAFLNLGRHADAIPILEAALQWHRDDPSVLNNLAIAKYQTGQADAARALLEESLAANPTHDATHANLAMVAAGQQRNEDALLHVSRAVELAPARGSYQRQRAGILARLGRTADARAAWARAAELEPHVPENAIGLAEACLALGDVACARGAVEAARPLAPGDPRIASLEARLGAAS